MVWGLAYNKILACLLLLLRGLVQHVLSPIAPIQIISELDCLQALGIKRYTLDGIARPRRICESVQMNHPLRCRCGTLKGYVNHPEKVNRAVCYCKDCQAYAHFLGKTGDILDEMGGTDVVATLPKYVSFTQGFEALTCMSLTENGLLRWYASCCNTPIGNTPRDYKVSFVGLVHTCLEDPSTRTLESSFGPVRMRVNTKNAKGRPKALLMSTIGAVLRFMIALIRARLDGSYKRTPFFVSDRGTPVVTPKVLTSIERERVMNAV
jgi:hypothetical protein